MNLQDKTLRCRECGTSFVFTAGEQGFYLEKGLAHEPQRCPTCRAIRRRERSGAGEREAATIVCASCGREATVPFVPRFDRPVYCSTCFSSQRAERAPLRA
jgi:CxxC-x17-CxxC domain-containing protein